MPFVLVVLWWFQVDLGGRYVWKQHRTFWEEQGESFEMEELLPPVSDEDNFAKSAFVLELLEDPDSLSDRILRDYPELRFLQVTHGSEEPQKEGVPFRRCYEDGEPPLVTQIQLETGEPFSVSFEDVAERVEGLEPHWEKMLSALQRKECRFAYDSHHSLQNADAIALNSALEIVMKLEVAALSHLHTGKADSAFEELLVLIRNAEWRMASGCEISNMEGLNWLSSVHAVVWEGLRLGVFTESQLEQLSAALIRMDPMESSLQSMRVSQAAFLGHIERELELGGGTRVMSEFLQLGGPTGIRIPQPNGRGYHVVTAFAIINQNRIFQLQEAFETPHSASEFAVEKVRRQLTQPPWGTAYFVKAIEAMMGGNTRIALSHWVGRDVEHAMCLLAMDMNRHLQVKGTYPESLDLLQGEARRVACVARFLERGPSYETDRRTHYRIWLPTPKIVRARRDLQEEDYLWQWQSGRP